MNIQSLRYLVLAFTSLPLMIGAAHTAASESDMAAKLKAGKNIAFDRKKGNCLACHVVNDGESPGAIGPPLVSMRTRFPDKAKLRAQIRDATIVNPVTIMPPFGPHKILSNKEIDLVVDYIHSL